MIRRRSSVARTDRHHLIRASGVLGTACCPSGTRRHQSTAHHHLVPAGAVATLVFAQAAFTSHPPLSTRHSSMSAGFHHRRSRIHVHSRPPSMLAQTAFARSPGCRSDHRYRSTARHCPGSQSTGTSRPPSMFVQVAFASWPPLSVRHSSTSVVLPKSTNPPHRSMTALSNAFIGPVRDRDTRH